MALVACTWRCWKNVPSFEVIARCCVKVNRFSTEWFDVRCGLKQGCPLSPTLFSFFVND